MVIRCVSNEVGTEFLNIIIFGSRITVAWNVLDTSNTGIMGSNPTRSMDACVRSVFMLSCVRTGFATIW
jgi:hypothetical protein